MSAHPLTTFIYETFGRQFGDLLLAGYGAEPEAAQAEKKFYIQETQEGSERQWEIEVIANALPCHSEPLVLAALLKMLLRRKDIPFSLEFQMSEILDELLCAGVVLTHDSVDRIISKYVGVFYDKRARNGDELDEAGGGVYSLVAGFFRGNVNEVERINSAQVSNNVQFDQSFVAGLRLGQIILAGIRFGRLRHPLTS
jgi:hypothetical protein